MTAPSSLHQERRIRQRLSTTGATLSHLDRAAYAELCHAFLPRLAAMARRRGLSPERAASVAAEVMVLAWRSSGERPGHPSPATHLYALAGPLINKAAQEPAPLFAAPSAAAPGEQAIPAQRLHPTASFRGASRLPPRQKQILELALLSGLDAAGIERRLSVPFGTVAVSLQCSLNFLLRPNVQRAPPRDKRSLSDQPRTPGDLTRGR